MLKKERFVRKILVLAGIIEVAVGLLHFFMPSFVYQSPGFMTLESKEVHFVTLVIFAVGILLMAFGSVTFFMTKFADHSLLYYYSLIKSFLWLGRVGLEIAYPIELRLFWVEPFTSIVLPGLVFELLLFVCAAFCLRKRTE